MGGAIAGRYQPEGILGKGGMGEVLVAEDSAAGRKVALKLLHATTELQQPSLSSNTRPWCA